MMGVGGEGAAVFFLLLLGIAFAIQFLFAAALITTATIKRWKPVRIAGWIVLATCVPVGFVWVDSYRSLERGREHWITLAAPKTIDGVEYVGKLVFLDGRVSTGTLARNQDVQGIRCLAKTEVHYTRKSGHLEECTLAGPVSRQGAVWPTGTILWITADYGSTYTLPAGADPVRIEALIVHPGLTIRFDPRGRLAELSHNWAIHNADTLLEVGDFLLKGEYYTFDPDGAIHGGYLVRAAVVNGKAMKAGTEVVLVPNRGG